ncbi:hypothetical protein ODZ84_00650 [Chryseobacterium fluminis]|uniref:hypothetical protein n=1 Tax=Chryseobacterium fluminis TaxID=2983606 RepID=UPI00224FEE4D|nr:hypothetical protein [Chryseobacterium sp. MMS21-Ot14]UZT98113.1 hypothetical protein ODZ84_00650 [Chryseobacterium sp. MMS21-Ot14]
MKKNAFILVAAATLMIGRVTAQVGINTANPQGVFSVDGAKDNPATGTPTATQQLNDFSVTATGNVGIGNVAPAAKLDIVGDTFGIKRSQGSGSWDNFWIDLSAPETPAVNASGADNGLQFKVGANATGTYGNGQTLTTVATMTPAGNMGIGTAAPAAKLHVEGIESRFSSGTSRWALAPTTGGTSGSSNSFEIIDRIQNVRRMVFNDNGDVSLGGGISDNSSAGVVSIRSGNVGIGTASPSEKLDVDGKIRVRTISPVSHNTAVSPAYTDANGVFVKTSAESFGTIVSNQSASVSSGATGTLISGLPNGGIYKAVVTVGDGCSNTSIAEFMVATDSFNGNYGVKGLDGFITAIGTKAPSFTETNSTTTGVAWTGKPGCNDGVNSTGFNYTLAMPNASTINITNNGNVSRSYRIILTKYY